jgi:hypothetical protein
VFHVDALGEGDWMLRNARLLTVGLGWLVTATLVGCGGGSGAAMGSGGASGSGGTTVGTGGTGTGGAPGTDGLSGGTGGAGPITDAATGTGGATATDASPTSDSAGDIPATTDGKTTTLGFFVTSTGSGTMGGNLGGLAGADAKCQALAAVVGAGSRTWHAYLSISGATPVNARDRIGTGPWYNAKGVKIADNLAQLHDEGGMNALSALTAVDENGLQVPTANPNEHDVFTGTAANGMALPATPDLTCAGWTAATGGAGQCGHCNRMGNTGNPPTSWNSAHATPGCSTAQIQSVGGSGRFYCFAVN